MTATSTRMPNTGMAAVIEANTQAACACWATGLGADILGHVVQAHQCGRHGSQNLKPVPKTTG